MQRRIADVLVPVLVALALTGCEGPGGAPTPARPPATSPQVSVPPVSVPPVPPQPSNAYLGESAPGDSPILFAPTVVRGDLHTAPVFTPDGTEAYWSLQDATIQGVRLDGGEWTEPETVSFSAEMSDYGDPFISPSGEEILFLSTDTPLGSDLQPKENVWCVSRKGDGWGTPRPLKGEVNDLELHWQVSVAANGDLYVGSVEPGLEDIFVSRLVDGRYATPERLSDRVNTDAYETTPYIAPDLSYLLFSRVDTGSGDADLFISYPDGAGDWGEPVEVDSVGYALAPVVSPDGRYLFFLSSPQTVSWVDTTFVEELRPEGLRPQSNAPS